MRAAPAQAQVSPPATRCTLRCSRDRLVAHQKRIYDDCAYIWILESIGKSCYHSRFKPFLNRVEVGVAVQKSWPTASVAVPASSVALLTHGEIVACSLECLPGSQACIGSCSRPYSPIYLFSSAFFLLCVCLCIVWIALTCEALRQYLCTTLCQCAKCRRSRRCRRWSRRCRFPYP